MGSKDGLGNLESKSNKRPTRRGIGGPDLVVGIATVVVVGVAGKLFSILKSSNAGNAVDSASKVVNGDKQVSSLLTDAVSKQENSKLDSNGAIDDVEKQISLPKEKAPDDDGASITTVDLEPSRDGGSDINTVNSSSTHQFLDPLFVSQEVKENDFSSAHTLSELVNHALLDAKHDSATTHDILNKTKAMHEQIAGAIARAFEDFGGEFSSGDEHGTKDHELTWKEYEAKSANTQADSESETGSDASGDSLDVESSIPVTEDPKGDLLKTEAHHEHGERIKQPPATEGDHLSDCLNSTQAYPGGDSIDGASKLSSTSTFIAESATPPQPESATTSVISAPKPAPSSEEQIREETLGEPLPALACDESASEESKTSTFCGFEDSIVEMQEEYAQVSNVAVNDGAKLELPEVQDWDLLVSPELHDDEPGVLSKVSDVVPDVEETEGNIVVPEVEDDKPEFLTGVADKEVEVVRSEVLQDTISSLGDNLVTQCDVNPLDDLPDLTSKHVVGVSVKITDLSVLHNSSDVSTDITNDKEADSRGPTVQRPAMIIESHNNVKSIVLGTTISESNALSVKGRGSNQESLRDRLPLEGLGVAALMVLMAFIVYTFYGRFQAL